MPFNFNTLDSTDFEYISKDIAEILTKTKLTCYPAGPDGGIDASDFYCENYDSPIVIVQAKHWETTGSISKLKTALQALVIQLEKYATGNPIFYLFTTLKVTRNKQKEFHAIARAAGFERFSVIDHTKISDLLERAEYKNVLRKHFKLWLSHTNILSEIVNRDKFIDCEMFLGQVADQEQLFVQTSIYDEAMQCLTEDDVVVIVGDPGTGKTTLSKMLVLYFAGDGYTVYYTASGNADDVKNLLDPDPDAKELVILDDFLGQRCLDVNVPKLRSVSSLIAYIRKSKHRKIILNSRLTILNEARDSDREFRRLMNSLDDATKITNTDLLTDLDRARILHSNLLYYGVPLAYIKNVASLVPSLGSRGYMAIVQHRNYNPRVIEHVCSEEVYCRARAEDYLGLFWMVLNNPEEVWRNEFVRRLEPSDRAMMYTLFSLTDQQTNEDTLHDAFEQRAFDDGAIDTSSGAYEVSSTRLKDALLRHTIAGGKTQVSVLNPSINDYISSQLKHADSEAASIIKSAKYSDQIMRITTLNKSRVVRDLVVGMIQDGDFLAMPSIDSSTDAHFLQTVIALDLIDDAYSKAIQSALICLANNNDSKKFIIGSFVKELLDYEVYEHVPAVVQVFRDLKTLEDMFSCLDLDDATLCYRLAALLAEDEQERKRVESLAKIICKNKIKREAYNFFDGCIVQCSEDLVESHFFYDEEERRFTEDSGDMSAFQKACLDALLEDTEKLFEQLRDEMKDESLFSEFELNEIIELEAESVTESAWPFDWVFEQASEYEPTKRIHFESDKQNIIDRLFADYI